ncbi:MAG TPA: hypothetical protein VK978_00210 [Candidatus Saccharimonadales bacterium]|nr:hypothetical protein [Candidatus Saccharimonadales bacterium]
MTDNTTPPQQPNRTTSLGPAVFWSLTLMSLLLDAFLAFTAYSVWTMGFPVLAIISGVVFGAWTAYTVSAMKDYWPKP